MVEPLRSRPMWPRSVNEVSTLGRNVKDGARNRRSLGTKSTWVFGPGTIGKCHGGRRQQRSATRVARKSLRLWVDYIFERPFNGANLAHANVARRSGWIEAIGIFNCAIPIMRFGHLTPALTRSALPSFVHSGAHVPGSILARCGTALRQSCTRIPQCYKRGQPFLAPRPRAELKFRR